MEILVLMIVCSISLSSLFLVLFVICAKKGQFEQGEAPAVRMLFDSETQENQKPTNENTLGDVSPKNKL